MRMATVAGIIVALSIASLSTSLPSVADGGLSWAPEVPCGSEDADGTVWNTTSLVPLLESRLPFVLNAPGAPPMEVTADPWTGPTLVHLANGTVLDLMSMGVHATILTERDGYLRGGLLFNTTELVGEIYADDATIGLEGAPHGAAASCVTADLREPKEPVWDGDDSVPPRQSAPNNATSSEAVLTEELPFTYHAFYHAGSYSMPGVCDDASIVDWFTNLFTPFMTFGGVREAFASSGATAQFVALNIDCSYVSYDSTIGGRDGWLVPFEDAHPVDDSSVAQLFIGDDLNPDNSNHWGVARCGGEHSVINPEDAGDLFVQLAAHEVGHNFEGTHDAPHSTSCGVAHQAGPFGTHHATCDRQTCSSLMTKGTRNTFVLMYTNDANSDIFYDNVGLNMNPAAESKYPQIIP